MKFGFTLTTLLLGAFWTTALPTVEPEADPPRDPVTVEDAPTSNRNCDGRIYTPQDIYNAVQYGVLLEEDNMTRGRNKYPEVFTQNPGGLNLMFPSYCPGGDTDRMSYPLKMGAAYNGGPNNVNQGPDRAVYMHARGEVDEDGHDLAQFCGLMRHTGGTPNGFVRCVAA